MPATEVPLLSAEDRAEILRMFTEMKAGYGTLTQLITEAKPTGEIKVKLEKIDESIMDFHAKHTAATAKIDQMEVKLNERIAQAQPPKSIGQQVVENAGFLTAIKSGGRFAVTVSVKGSLWQVKDIINLSSQWPQMIDYVAAPARPPIGTRTLIPGGRTSAGAVEYIEETSFANNAAPVAEGAPKPKSDKVFTPRTVAVRTIAHYFKVSKQTFDDLPFLVTQIDNNGVWGVQKVEDNQLLNGSGAPPNLQGLMTVATAAPAPVPATGATLVDAVGAAVFDLAAKGWLPDGSVVNPSDWGQVAMLKNSLGNYLFANPMDYTPNGRLWGTRVVYSSNMVAGNFLAGAFQGNSQLLDREEVNIQVATQNEDDFIHNMVTILVEERIVLLIYNPAAFEKGVVPVVVTAGLESGAGETAPNRTPRR
jgi:hypothetical protein